MPVQPCRCEDGSPGLQWGDQGRCYPYDPGQPGSEGEARGRASRQGRAAYARGYQEQAKAGPLVQGVSPLRAGRDRLTLATYSRKNDLRDLWDLQEDYADTVDRSWQSTMGRAVQQFASTSRWTRQSITDGMRRLDQIAVRFGRNRELMELTETAMRGAYGVGILSIYDRWTDLKEGRTRSVSGDGLREPAQKAKPDPGSILVQVSFTQADEAALAELSDGALVWFRDRSGAHYFDVAARQAIVDKAREMIRDGVDQVGIAKAMREAAEGLYGVGTFAGRGRSYWGGVAEHMATVAGVRGQLTELRDLGFERYELINPMDDRTTRICSAMNGKTFIVEHGFEQQRRLGGAGTPDDVRKLHPFAPGGGTGLVERALGRALSRGEASMSSADSRLLNSLGLAVPPFHFRCRTYLDVSYDGPGRVPRLEREPPAPSRR